VTRSRHLLPPRRYWTEAEVELLVRLYADTSTQQIADQLGCGYTRVASRAYMLGLRKSAEFNASSWAHRLDGTAGERTRFQVGQAPWNKGMKGLDIGGKETRFKPGNVSKRWDPDIYIVGALRITSDGILQIKLAPGARQWVQMSHYTWRLHTGRWPRKGCVLRARNGDPHDTRFENLELLTLRQNMLRNSVHAMLPPELARLVQLQGAIKRQINKRMAA
jgi:hypothetical protein